MVDPDIPNSQKQDNAAINISCRLPSLRPCRFIIFGFPSIAFSQAKKAQLENYSNYSKPYTRLYHHLDIYLLLNSTHFKRRVY